MRGVRESVQTSAGNVYRKQTDKLGRTYYRKNGKFVSKRSYVAAKASRNSVAVRGALDRIDNTRTAIEEAIGETLREDEYPYPVSTLYWIPRPGKTPNTIEERKAANDFGRVGKLGPFILPQYDEGDLVENEEDRQILVQEGIFQRSFIGFWEHPVNEGLSRDEAVERFTQFLNAMRGVRSQEEQNLIRQEFGLDGNYSYWKSR